MKHGELFRDQSSVERGNELISLMQECYSARVQDSEYWDERQNYFDNTVKLLINSMPFGNIDDKAYADLGRAVIDAEKTQDQYNTEDEKEVWISDWDAQFVRFGADVYNFLDKHKGKPIVVANILPEKSPKVIWSNKKFGTEFPVFAEGHVGGFEFRNEVSIMHLASRLVSNRTLYSVRVLDGAVPQVKLAIGE